MVLERSLDGVSIGVGIEREHIPDMDPLNDSTPSSTSTSPTASLVNRPSLAFTWRASSAPPRVPVSQPPAAATTKSSVVARSTSLPRGTP